MTIHFYKYQGTGNDFIMIDDRSIGITIAAEAISKLCHRRMGIGADGLILIKNHDELDFEMVYFNADGSQSLCGNGSRCAVNFAKQLGIVTRSAKFLTIDGVYQATIDDEIVNLAMKDIDGLSKKDEEFFIDNGSPHHIIFTKKNRNIDVFSEGKLIRESKEYEPNGTNVNFVEILSENSIDVRTFERGVEDETLSCGTGVAASALASSQKGIESPVNIRTKGGNLKVSFTKHEEVFKNIVLSGPAEMVFKGSVEV